MSDLRVLGNIEFAEPCAVHDDFDLCFVVVQFPHELRLLDRIRGWRERSKIAAVFVLELWSAEVERAHDLRRLDRFDHVFLANDSAIPLLRRRTATPVTALPLAVDARRAAPEPVGGRLPSRPIDIASLGRRQPAVHERLVEIARRRGMLYLYDGWTGMRADDWETCREIGAETMRRSRYAVVWGPTIAPAPHKAAIMGTDRPMSARFFEATTSGAVMIGDYHASMAIDRLLDWPDALVRIREDGADVEAAIEALEADPERRRRIHVSNIVNGLRRHDWSHRWAEVLTALGLEPTQALAARQQALEARAKAVEATRQPAVPKRRVAS